MCRVHHEKRWAGGSTSWNKIAGRNINNLRYADDTTLMAESEEELKSLLMKGKEESEKVGLTPTQHSKNKVPSIRSHHFMANRRRKSDSLYFLGLQKSLWMVTAAMKLKEICSLEGKLQQI